jgi:hypothetical protein
MWHKHAVWCQCALALHLVLAGAAIVSCQSMTLFVDVYWAIVLSFGTLCQFVAAEHAAFAGMSADQWIRLEKHRALWVHWILALWHIFRGTSLATIVLSVLLGGLTFVSVPPFVCFCCAAGIHGISSPGYISWIWCVWGLALFRRHSREPMLLGKSLASPVMREIQMYKALVILAEGICVWQVRCAHRFPHTFRWTPFFISVCGFILATVYSDRHVAKTRVTHNAIISSIGHGVAASYTAAQECPVCSKSLNSLDMEASFRD